MNNLELLTRYTIYYCINLSAAGIQNIFSVILRRLAEESLDLFKKTQQGFLKLIKKTHQKTALTAALVNLIGMLNDRPDNLNDTIPQTGPTPQTLSQILTPAVNGFIKLTKKSLIIGLAVWIVETR